MLLFPVIAWTAVRRIAVITSRDQAQPPDFGEPKLKKWQYIEELNAKRISLAGVAYSNKHSRTIKSLLLGRISKRGSQLL